MFIYLNKKAQSTAEYVIVLGLIVGAVIAMQTYLKRGLQGRIRDAVDFTDNQGAGLQFNTTQYEPYYLSSNFNSNSNSNEREALAADTTINRVTGEDSAKAGEQIIGAVLEE
jgi:restriction endonuclease S subunit